jgi:hypothetical protein
VNRGLAKDGADAISSVLKLKRVEPCEGAKTAEGRRQRKEKAIFTVEEDIGVSAKSLQMEQIRSLALRGDYDDLDAFNCSFMLKSKDDAPDEMDVHSDESASNNSSSSIENDERRDASTSVLEDGASACAASVLLMLSRA